MLRNIAKKFLLFIIITNVLSSCNEEPFDWSFGDFKIENVSNIVETTTNSAKIRTTIDYKGTMHVDSIKHVLNGNISGLNAVCVDGNIYESEFNVLGLGQRCVYNVYIWANGSTEPIHEKRFEGSFNIPGKDITLECADIINVTTNSAVVALFYYDNLSYVPLEEVELGVIYNVKNDFRESKPVLYDSRLEDLCLVHLNDLNPNTTYYCKPYLKYQGDIYYGASTYIIKTLEGELQITDNVDFVDLGLGVLWASKNVGSSSAAQCGNMYNWGHIDSESSVIPDYTGENLTGTGYDVAKVESSSIMCLTPTRTHWLELINSCEWTWGEYKGSLGYKVEGPNGNSIFLPVDEDGFSGYMCGTKDNNEIVSVALDKNEHKFIEKLISNLLVRPVQLKHDITVESNIEKIDFDLGYFSTLFVQMSLNISNQEFVTEAGVWYAKKLTTPSEHYGDMKAASLNNINITGLDLDTVYNYCIYIKVDDILIFDNNIKTFTTPAAPEFSTEQVVDLGLSVKWAGYNVGATKPWEYGNYYAWGEINTKSEYTIDNSLTYGREIDYDISGNPEFDVARAEWGGSWRLPTRDELDELYSKCKFMVANCFGEYDGFILVGPNGNSILLPAAGSGSYGGYYGVGSRLFYWTSTPCDFDYAYIFYFDGVTGGIEYDSRYIGGSVRPVCD